MTLLEQCQKWHENDEHQKIIDALEAIPAGERTPEMDMELARAYNNLADPAQPEGRKLLRKALELMQPHEEELGDTYSWNFRMGYAYYYLDQEGRALPHFEKALELHPGDDPKLNTRQEIEELIDWCRKGVSLPQFSACFRQRTESAWEAFVRQEAQLRRIMDEDKDHTRGAELVAQMEEILNLAFDEISFEMGVGGEKYELILTPEGDKVKLFELCYFQKHAPQEVLEHWNILVGRQPSPNTGLRTEDGWDISGEEVQIWLEEQGENSFAISAYCEKLLPMLREEEGRIWWMLTTLTDQVLGEIPHMRYIDDFDVLEEPKAEPSFPLSQLPDKLKEKGANLTTAPEAYLDSCLGYEMEPNKDPDADWRLDVMAGSTCCASLVNGYLNADNGFMDELHADGAAAGFFCYPLDTLREEKGSEKIFAFRDRLEEALAAGDGPEALTLTGGATGLYCGYVDFIAWDIRAVLQKAKEFFEGTDIPWASFHTFRREAGTVALVDREAEHPPVDPETGSLLTQRQVDALEAHVEEVSGYFGRMLDDLNQMIEDCIREGRFTRMQARRDLQSALWYSYACNNMDQDEFYYRAAQWMPDSEGSAKGCGTWYYRYACALTYCGRLEEALRYAEQGVAEEPEYPWGWLHLAKLRAHFGDREGALAAVQQGLALVPGDHEFLTLEREIHAGATLEQMEYHWIDPAADLNLQEGTDPGEEDKLRSISCITTDQEGLAEFWRIFQPDPADYTRNAPYCSFHYPVQGQQVELVFCMNEAGLSKLGGDWLRARKAQLDSGTSVCCTTPQGEQGTLEAVLFGLDRRQRLFYRLEHPAGEEKPCFQVTLDENGLPLQQAPAGQTAQSRAGIFTGFVLLKTPEWNKAQLILDLKERWDLDAVEDDDPAPDALVFSVGDMIAAVSLVPAPVPQEEAEQNAANNYLWPDAQEAARTHQAHLVVAVLGKEEDLLEKGRLFVKVASCCCRQQNAAGVYTSGVVLEPAFYERFAGMMREGELPLFNWVWFGLYRGEEGMCAYTCGLDAFGKDEMEVLEADAEPADVRDFLISIAGYVLENDVTLQDGETIGFSAEDKHLITRSPGVGLPEEQMTLKISYAPLGESGASDPSVMDDGEWHLETIREKRLPVDELSAYSHMAIYLRWCMEEGLMSGEFLQRYHSLCERFRADPAHTDLRPVIRDELAGQLFYALFDDEGEAFARYYYGGGRAPYFPSDIDDYAIGLIGQERNYSDEIQDEAYLFLPFDEDYYQAMAQVIGERFEGWRRQHFDEGTLKPSELAGALMEYLDCECTYFPSMKDDDPIMAAYGYARRDAAHEGFVPVLIRADDETLLECLVMNADPKNDADFYEFDLKTVTEYRKKMLSAPVKDGKAVLEELIGQRREEAGDDDLDWEEEILGEMEGGEPNDRFSCYWDGDTGMTYPLILAKIPVKNPWEIFAWLPFGGWNECPDTPELMAAAKYWARQYGAAPAAMSHDELEFLLPAPVPKEKAMDAAEEMYGFCPDVTDQGPEDATVGALADVLRQSTVWYFWWD